jgi:HK97 family phage portal protein
MGIFSGITRLFKTEKRGVGDPTTSLGSPAPWLVNLLNLDSDSGVDVNQDTVLGITAMYRAVKLLGETIGSLKGCVYQRMPDGSIEKRLDHPLNMLMREPSPRYTGMSFFEAQVAYAIIRGNAYADIRRDADERPSELIIVQPGNVAPRLMSNGDLVYSYTYPEGRSFTRFSPDVFHVPNLILTQDNLKGLGVIDLFKNALGNVLAFEKYEGRLFKNGGFWRYYIKHPGDLSAKARENIATSLSERYGGWNQAGKGPVLDEGMELKELGLDPQKAMLIESKRFGVEDISRITGVPAHMLSSLERATFSNIEQQSREFVIHGVLPWTRRFESETDRKLFTEAEKRDGYFWRFDLDELLRGDTEARSKLYNVYAQNGIATRNEIRQMEGMNKVEYGDNLYVPLNFVELGENGSTEEE